MKNKLSALIGILCFAVLIAGAYVLYQEMADDVELPQLATQSSDGTQGAEPERTPMPDITVYDRDGNAVKLSDFRGKPVVLNFWASWCGPCKSEMPDFDAAYKKYADQIHFLMVNVTDGYQETKEKASALIADQGYSFPVYFDRKAEASSIMGINSLPTTFFVDAEGYPVAYATGALNEANVEKGIGMILNAG